LNFEIEERWLQSAVWGHTKEDEGIKRKTKLHLLD